MTIKQIDATHRGSLKAIATILHETFPHAYKDFEEGFEEVESLFEGESVVLVAEDNNTIVGVIGAKAQYSHTGWELHPLAVVKSHRGKGLGSALVKALENKMRSQACVVLYLGTDDEFFQTSLSQEDLFADPLGAIKRIKNLKNHPYTFYQKMGFKIVGVIPDANGLNKPDIMMAKRMELQKR